MFEEYAKLLAWLIPIVLLAVIILPQMILNRKQNAQGDKIKIDPSLANEDKQNADHERRDQPEDTRYDYPKSNKMILIA
jgi:hypothetical protein